MIVRRLEAGERFCEITLAERHVEIATEERLEVRDFDTVREAQFLVADTENQLRMYGFREVSYEETYPPGHRDRALEDAIAATPDDPTPYLVYADWLQQRGDPRGELIVVQEALVHRPRERALLDEQARLFEQHCDLLRGPTAQVGPITLDWYCGFVRGLDLGGWLAMRGRRLLRPILAHTSFAFLRALAGHVGTDRSLGMVADKLPATLERLELGVLPEQALVALSDAMDAARLPRLRDIRINDRRYRSVAEWRADRS